MIRNAKSYDFGGAERFPTFVAEVLKSNAYTPVVLSASKQIRTFASEHGVSTVTTWWWSNQDWSGLRALLFPIYVAWQLILTLHYLYHFSRLRPLAIHVQSKDDFIGATFAAKLLGITVVWNDHADLKHIWKNLYQWDKNPVGKLVYFAALCSHAIIVSSKSEAQFIAQNLHDNSLVWKKFSLIYNGARDVSASYKNMSHTDTCLTYCIANRLVTDKGLNETINAYMSLHKQHPDTRLLILGDGPEADDFRELAKDDSSVVFLGHQSNPYEIMSQSDVFLQPTYHDAFSVVIVEASMLGLPIIATAVGGNREIIFDKKTGLLVPPKDTVALEEAMELLYRDSALRKKIAIAARKNYLTSFMFDDIVMEQIVPLYVGGSPYSLQPEEIK